MTQPMVHLICGSTGAGKTTYSLELKEQVRGIHFSIDEWMSALFSPEANTPVEAPDLGAMFRQIARCHQQIWATAAQVSTLGTPTILDLGFQRTETRNKFVALAAGAGLDVQLHFLDVGVDERWRRVDARNVQQGETFRLTVTRPMFDFIEGIWEPPTTSELKTLRGIRLTAD